MSQPMAPPPPPPGAAPASSNRSLMLILSYLGLLALIPLLVEKEDSEVQWHAKNGLVFFGAYLVLWFALMAAHFVPFLGCLLIPVHFLAFIGFVVITIMGIVKAMNGERFIIPGLSDLANKF